ncbi:deleted in malignant brain tumors 1 protein-like [Lytechinus pictus]|uniref:deleted in malignant brain tumors 1 protein-like n=1 Tax=Lytechinus pictus TaxID=7653 RepID=UPI0030B9FFC0
MIRRRLVFHNYSLVHILIYLVINVDVRATPLYNDGDVQLVGGSTSLEGRVEVYYQGSWGTVCDDFWDEQDAMVVCNQVMPGYVGINFGHAYFGEGVGDIILDDVYCTGTESSLLDCAHSGLYNHDCLHVEDASVRCYMPTNDGDIQLIGGGAAYQGRVEIFYNFQWGTVCDDSWDLQDATVVCRQLGFTGATDAPQRAHFGAGSGAILLDDLRCTGSESMLVNCPGADFYQHNCVHNEDASVICIPPSDGDIKVVNGTSREGELQIYLDGVWMSICATDWSSEDATVACRQLGFTHSVGFGASDYRSDGDNFASFRFYCEGDETSLTHCDTHEYFTCHSTQATVSCHVPDDGDLRLQGGNIHEGRVEVYYQGQWGTVCDDNWDQQDAQVVCTQLGFPGAVEALSMAYFGQGGGPIHLDGMDCTGSETRLADCLRQPWTQHDCSHYEDASVICLYNEDGDIRLVDGSTANEGRVEIWMDDRGWMTICDSGWDEDDGEVVCRQMGYEGVVEVTQDSSFGGGTEDVFATMVECTGNEDSFLSCAYDDHTYCTHSNDAGVVCALPDGESRLVDGDDEYSGRVEIFHDNRWWTVCGDWDDYKAKVLCNELGYKDVALSRHSFGPGSGDLAGDLYCYQHSATLRDCTYSSTFDNTGGCTHDDDVGVVCDETKFVSGAVRLVSGNVPYAGRVEIFTGERWGSICDVAWDIEDAHVVCRQVGYKRATFAKKGAFFGMNTYRVVVVGYNCLGTELTLDECPLAQGTILSDCTHQNDSGVICEQDYYNEFSVELIGNATYQSSRVSLFHDGQWKSVCSDNWDWRTAQVACRQAGYFGTSYHIDQDAFRDFHPMVFTGHDIACDGSEYHLYYCSADWDSLTCTSNKVASVTCAESYEDLLQDGDLRLTNGTSSKDGQIEMFDEGFWRPVCGDEWGWEEATVACRQLGYLGAISAYTAVRILQFCYHVQSS